MAYDVGEIVRDYSTAILGVSPNRATPEVWIAVLHDLAALTDGLVRADVMRRTTGAPIPTPEDQITRDLQAWRDRLGAYQLAAHAAPEGDRAAIADDVTAPLLLGWYPGEPTQRAADVATPYALANQLDVAAQWRAESLQRLVDDAWSEASGVVTTGRSAVSTIVVATAIVVAAVILGR